MYVLGTPLEGDFFGTHLKSLLFKSLVGYHQKF